MGGQRGVYEVTEGGARRVLKLMPAYATERAEREVTIGQRFDHPGLARIISDLQEVMIDGEDYVFFTEEFIEGAPLDALPRLELCEALDLALQLVEASEHLYAEHRVVHRDIKPQNIMKRDGGGFVLLDVGVGRHQDLTTITAEDAAHGPGTRGFLAPEQLQPSKGHELDWRTDQFAIGIVLFQQLTGRLPFDPNGPSYRTVLVNGLVAGMDDVPEAARPVLERMLHAKPHRRFRLGRTADALGEAREAAGCS